MKEVPGPHIEGIMEKSEKKKEKISKEVREAKRRNDEIRKRQEELRRSKEINVDEIIPANDSYVDSLNRELMMERDRSIISKGEMKY